MVGEAAASDSHEGTAFASLELWSRRSFLLQRCLHPGGVRAVVSMAEAVTLSRLWVGSLTGAAHASV